MEIYDNLLEDCKGVEWIENAFKLAWKDYESGLFSYDGATFVKEVYNDYWEVASFIHDWLNVTGYIGKDIDLYFIKIMIHLQYPERRIYERCKWMQLTFINVLRHRIKGTFKSNKLPKFL